ncbi:MULTISPECIES: DUF397 domain-containing protein [unclassified Nocardia]|uniref:DUF397 domain-containing protein n=1 Tax=unclassified Nocardia TaxID=2637762 RepID=UPI00278C5BD9|nr:MULTISPECIES: DUF397 domain-containing protein [unclassified Nocardia]
MVELNVHLNGAEFIKPWSGESGNCVEVACLRGGDVAVRDSKHHGRGPVLRFTPEEWRRFVAAATTGQVPH